MPFDFNLLPVFLAVAEERSFRAAADRLGVTRSAVSQAMFFASTEGLTVS